MARIRLITAVQSPISRALIGRLLARLPSVAVVGEAETLGETVALATSARPDIAVLGASLANSREFEHLRPVLVAASCRWIEVAGRQLAAEGSVRPILSPGLSDLDATRALQAVLVAPLQAQPLPERPPGPAPATSSDDRIILMGASTGGVDALLEVLAAFPSDCPPTAIVQHTGRDNAGNLIQLLGQGCRAEVVAPRDGMELRRGMVCVAAGGGQHLRIRAGSSLRCLLHRGPPVTGHLPSVDELFQSAPYGRTASSP